MTKLDMRSTADNIHPNDLGMSWKGSRLAPEVGLIGMLKGDPGHWYDGQGNPVSEAVARLVGWDVEHWSRIRFLAEKRAAFEAELQEEMRKATCREAVIVEERGGFAVHELGSGRHNVVDIDGSAINVRPLTLHEALQLLNKLSPVIEEGQTDE